MQGGADPLIRVLARLTDDARQTVSEHIAMLRNHSDGRVELLAPQGDEFVGFDVGAIVIIARAVRNDAMYVRPFRIVQGEGNTPNAVWLVEVGDERREQQREHVRVDTPRVDVTFTALGKEGLTPTMLDDDGEPITVTGMLEDFSAGGLRAALDEPPFLRGSRVRVRTVLPNDGDGEVVDLPAEVRWVRPGTEATFIGVQFEGVRPLMEQRFTSWVFAQQAKHRRSAMGA